MAVRSLLMASLTMSGFERQLYHFDEWPRQESDVYLLRQSDKSPNTAAKRSGTAAAVVYTWRAT